MIELNEEKVVKAMAVEVQSYWWELWLANRYPNYKPNQEKYLQKIYSMNEICKAFGIPYQVIFDIEPNVSHAIPYAIMANGEKKELFSKFRKDFEEKTSKEGNVWDKMYKSED